MREVKLSQEVIGSYDCDSGRLDDDQDPANPLVKPGETLVALTEWDKVFLAAAIRSGADAQQRHLAHAIKSDPAFTGTSGGLAHAHLGNTLEALARKFNDLLPVQSQAHTNAAYALSYGQVNPES